MRRVVIPYAVVSVLWVLLSDAVVRLLVSDPNLNLIASTLKGWVFVAVTSALLLILVRRYGAQLKQREDALRENEERFRLFMDALPAAAFIKDETSTTLYCNQYMADIIGAREWLGRSVFDLFPHPVAEKMLTEDRRALEVGSSVTEEYVQGVDGQIRLYETHKFRLPRPSMPPLLGGIGLDITLRKQAEIELIAAKTAAESASITKSRFLGAASHDLRQPIQAIGLFSHALVSTGLSAEQERISKGLTQSIQLMGDTLNVLLDISRLDAGAIRASQEAIHAEALAQRIDADFSIMAAEKALRFKLWFPFKAMAIQTDSKLLMRLLGNLIGNAIKYTATGGILVGIRRRGDHALIQVWDTGSGIAPEHLDNIFQEYFQIGNPERDRNKGLGLGLSIVRRIASLLGTDVKCRSRPGKGTVFELRLPLADYLPTETSSPFDPEVSGDDAHPHLAGRRIVVIEDNVLVSDATKWSLELHDMCVTTYGSAEEALASPEIATADFYICDYSLPGMNGGQVLDAIQQLAKEPIKAVILTGDTSPEQIEKMACFDWYVLYKPVNLPRLLSVIEASETAVGHGYRATIDVTN
jgi:PAS domain S-box-containing protein